MTSIEIALMLTLKVRLFDLSAGWRILTAHVERIHDWRNCITVGFRPNKWSSSLTVDDRLQNTIHSVVTTHIILNIREAASRRLNSDISFDLHLSDIDFRTPRSRISFAEGPAVFHLDDDCENGIF